MEKKQNSQTIIFAGDFASHGRVVEYLKNEDYASLFSKFKPILGVSDFSVVNLESPMIGNGCKPIKKVGPSLCAPFNLATAARYAGFDMVTLANNHLNDYGADGIRFTLLRCKEENLETIGAGENLTEASKIMYHTIKGRRFAFINCCEHEFSIADENTPGCNPLNTIDQYYAIKKAKEEADNVVVIVHGGIEMYPLPTPRMQRTYRFFVDAGADLVVNHHQHCYSGYEEYKNGLIIYGLGNFCFDWQSRKNKKWNEGYLAGVSFSDAGIKLDLYPYIQCADAVGVVPMDSASKEDFFKKIDELNSVIADETLLKRKYQEHLKLTNKEFRAIISPYSNRYTTALCRRGLLPVIIPKYIYRRILLNIVNQSHIERLIHYLNSKLED